MNETVIKIENLSKLYRLGQIGTGTLSHDLNRWWAKVRGKEDPYAKIGQVNDRTKQAASDYVWALKDINLEVKHGEVLGIIGRNGAGKSTLLKLISRITAPTTGEIKAKGRIASLLEVGTGMHPEMTARENIYLNGAILGMKRQEIARKFDDIVEFAGCAMYVDTPVKRYSSGMRVRLGFAVAAFLEPDILIVDEVLAVGDAEFQKKAIGKMKEVSTSEGRTVLFVSHNMSAVKNLCKRIVLIDEGHIMFESDDVGAGIRHYLHIEQDGQLCSGEWRNRQGISENQYVDLLRFYVTNEDEHILRDIHRNNTPIYLCAEINIKQLHEYLSFAYFLYDTEGDLVYLSSSADKTKQEWPRFREGFQKVYTQIPARFLNGGRYIVELKAIIQGESILKDIEKAKPIISFEIRGGMSDSPFWPEGTHRKGILAPIFDWKVR
ncbi:ABC transporter, ATP-binding protein [Candidatus Vecturithrix granuli]|uniref:ABC transporter, ATP-binding protein n=1 Tax=Vecturithrix granuli TaxID=1499967 RepID=A0A081C000_VECG1|nr:ABC transporter, ATP-binding protein [Candidatus Vecturithrix granuli]